MSVPLAPLLSVDGEAVEPAGAAGVDERLLGAALAHMRRVPRHVLAARAVHVTEHGARAVRRYGGVGLRERHAVQGPVVAGVIVAVDEGTAERVRAGQDVVLIAGNLVAPWIERGRALDVVAVALLVAMQVD